MVINRLLSLYTLSSSSIPSYVYKNQSLDARLHDAPGLNILVLVYMVIMLSPTPSWAEKSQAEGGKSADGSITFDLGYVLPLYKNRYVSPDARLHDAPGFNILVLALPKIYSHHAQPNPILG